MVEHENDKTRLRTPRIDICQFQLRPHGSYSADKIMAVTTMGSFVSLLLLQVLVVQWTRLLNTLPVIPHSNYRYYHSLQTAPP